MLTIPDAYTCRKNDYVQWFRNRATDPEMNRSVTENRYVSNRPAHWPFNGLARVVGEEANTDLKHKLPIGIDAHYVWQWLENPTSLKIDQIIDKKMSRAVKVARMIISEQTSECLCFGTAITMSRFMKQYQIALAGNGSFMTPSEIRDFEWMQSVNQ